MCRAKTLNQEVHFNIQQKNNLYNEAIAFFELAEFGRIHIPEQKHVESYIPFIVNMAFCAELLLKFLLIEEGKDIAYLKKQGHNLKKLYNKLQQQTKELIYSSFKRPLIYDIGEELNKSKNAFVHWRYLVLNKIEDSDQELPTDKEPPKDNRIPFEKWLCLKPKEQKNIEERQNSRKQISLFFLKEFNEVLITICKSHL